MVVRSGQTELRPVRVVLLLERFRPGAGDHNARGRTSPRARLVSSLDLQLDIPEPGAVPRLRACAAQRAGHTPALESPPQLSASFVRLDGHHFGEGHNPLSIHAKGAIFPPDTEVRDRRMHNRRRLSAPGRSRLFVRCDYFCQAPHESAQTLTTRSRDEEDVNAGPRELLSNVASAPCNVWLIELIDSHDPRTLAYSTAVFLHFRLDGMEISHRILPAAINHVEKHFRPFNMAQELQPQSSPVMRTFNEAGNVR